MHQLVKFIIEGYDSVFGIDVSRFFVGVDDLQLSLDSSLSLPTYSLHSNLISGDERLYRELAKVDWYYQAWKWEYQKSLEIILESNSKNVLEVGCGNGAYLLNLKNQGFNCVGLELNRDSISAGKKLGIPIFDDQITKFSDSNLESFDIVCSFQVLEHIVDYKEFLSSCIKCLVPGGLLIMAVPNNDAYFFKFKNTNFKNTEYRKCFLLNLPPHHLNYWTEDSLSNVSKVFNLQKPNIYYEPMQKHRKELVLDILRFEHKYVSIFGDRIANILFQKLFISRFRYGDTILSVYKKQ